MPPDLLYPLSPYRSINRECMKANFSVVTAQQDLIEKEREKEELRHQQIQRHAEAVRQQVREREVQAVSQRRELFREGERLEEAARSHRARLDEIKEKKLRELRYVLRPQSSGSSPGKLSRRFRTRALTSYVDETLFGTPKQPKSQRQSASSLKTSSETSGK
ncbi:unnamed protein product [Leuciscus chuanchicus]